MTSFTRSIVKVCGRAAMGNQRFIRDAVVNFIVNFFDSAGNAVNPSTAALTLSYLPLGGGDRTFVTYSLTRNGATNDWAYDWDSTIASACSIYGHAQTTAGNPIYSADFEFRLTANRANKELAGDD